VSEEQIQLTANITIAALKGLMMVANI